jgi:hypothetical protein
MTDNGIVGADPAPGGPFACFPRMERSRIATGRSANWRVIEEIDGRSAIRMIFRLDRFGRGGDH